MTPSNPNEECIRCGLPRSTCEMAGGSEWIEDCMRVAGQKHDFPSNHIVKATEMVKEERCNCHCHLSKEHPCLSTGCLHLLLCDCKDVHSPISPKGEKHPNYSRTAPESTIPLKGECKECEYYKEDGKTICPFCKRKLVAPTPPQSDWEEMFSRTFCYHHKKDGPFEREYDAFTHLNAVMEAKVKEFIRCLLHSKLSQIEEKSYEEGKREERKRIVDMMKMNRQQVEEEEPEFTEYEGHEEDYYEARGFNKAIDEFTEVLTKDNK